MNSQKAPQNRYPAVLEKIPEGYTCTDVEGWEKVIVPTAMLPHLHGSFDAYRTKAEKKVGDLRSRGFQVSSFSETPIAGGLFEFPPDPLFTQQEKLGLHAEVLALQNRLGISYKDAAHRLYMSEVEKLKFADKEAKAWANVAAGIKESLNDINTDFGVNKKENKKGKEREHVESDQDQPEDDEADSIMDTD